jgi:hypothetical protein
MTCVNGSPWRRCLCLVPLVAVLGATGFVLAPGAGAPALAQTTDPGSGQGGGAKNVVVLQNRVDGRLTTRSQVQLNRIPGPTAGPVNLASGESSCTDCQSLAVALQIDLISRTARSITPENAATAVNSGCMRCYTVARALQYVIQVDDPTQVPPEVTQLIQAMNRELTAIQADPTLSLDQAEARINAVLAQFVDLAQSLNDQRDAQADAAGPTPAVDATPTTVTPAMPSPTTAAGPAGSSVTPTGSPTTDSGASSTPVVTVEATPTATVGASGSSTTPSPVPPP